MSVKDDNKELEYNGGDSGKPGQQGPEDKSLSIEETLKELEVIIEKMEDRDRSLEDTFALYEAGMKMVKNCSEKIEKVEKKIEILSEEGQNGQF